MRVVEESSEAGVLGSILLLSADKTRLEHGGAPSLPAAYNEAINGIEIGAGVGSCGTAAATGVPVYVADIDSDPLWRDFRDLALSHGLRACWSTPIIDQNTDVLGTFAMYYPQPREPSPRDLELVDLITRAAALIITRARALTALADSEERLRLATEAAELGFWDVDPINETLLWPARVKAMFGISPHVPVTMQDFYDRLHPEDRERTSAAYALASDPSRRELYDVEYRTVGKEDGVVRWVAAKGRGLFDVNGVCTRVIGTAVDITARKQSEQALRELNETLERRVAGAILERQVWADMLEGTDDPVAALDADLKFIAMNRAYQDACERLFGVRFEIGQSLPDRLAHRPDVQASSMHLWSRALAGEHLDFQQSGERNANGSYYDLKFRPLTNREGRRIGAFQFSRDVTERVQAQRRLKEAEDALRQSHKMEAVGQLTGGIAHDFNNMLAVVLGSLDLLGRRIGASDLRAKRYVDAAAEAGKRAASLTQRLLAFSRQQPLQPEPINPNALVRGMSELLTHSLGGAVMVETVLAAGVWSVNADPNQLENVILNLAVNARDAMPEGGRLTIETQNVHIDERYAAANPGVSAGQYVMAALTDSGAGMAKEVMEKAFDPFFTTKAVGKGTGLGLSQVYGFVKQSGGHVKIYSEIGQGTSIKVYLPRLRGSAAEETKAEADPIPLLGEFSECILVVEDEPAVRQFSVDALSELGYRVVEADGAAAALRILQTDAEIALLFTDVVMPEVNGKKLADEAQALRPGLKVLFTTGYTRNAVVHNGVLDDGVELIGKPFTIEALAAKVRAMLES